MIKYLTVFLIVFGIVSCMKDEVIFIPDQTEAINREVLLSKFVDKPVSYRITLGNNEPTLFSGHKGVYINIPADALTDQNGKKVTGEIKLDFNEFTAEKTNLLYGPGNVFENGVFQSAKLIYIQFSQNDQLLRVTSPIHVYLPHDSQEVIENGYLLSGSAGNGAYNWKKNATVPGDLYASSWKISNGENNLSIAGYRIAVLGSDTWYTIAKVQSAEAGQDLQICLETEHHTDVKNSLAFFIAEEKNIVIPINQSQLSSGFCTARIHNDTSLPGKIILISDFGNENYYFGMTNAVLKDNQVLQLTSTRKNIIEIKQLLKQL